MAMSEARSSEIKALPFVDRLVISELDYETLNLGWIVENVKLSEDTSLDLDSGLLDLYPNCCKISFQVLFAKDFYVAHDEYDEPILREATWTLTIRTFTKLEAQSDGATMVSHLKSRHNVQHFNCDQYLIDRKGARIYLESKPHVTHRELNITLKSTELKNPSFLDNGALNFQTDFRMTKMQTSRREILDLDDTPGDLSINFGHLLESKDLCDFKIETEYETFPVHKAILGARSPVFKAMFTIGFKESKDNMVELPEFDAESMRIFLRYIYKDRLEFNDTTTINLKLTILQMADRYQVPRLKTLSELELIKSLSEETVCEILKAADTYSAKNLLNKALLYTRIHKNSLADHEDMISVLAHSEELARDVLKAICK